MLTIDIHKPLYGAGGEMELSVRLQINAGDFVALSGVSGSGKTTLLRVLAGLDSANGEIRMGGKLWLDGTKSTPPQQRSVGLIFQQYALFPHMNIEENLLYVSPDKKLAAELMEITGLSMLSQRRPKSLSGGQQQRVALCRAMMRRPELLLMDEPLSALDPKMRMELQQEIMLLHQRFGTTTVMVSHEPSEIYKMAKRIIVLDQGTVIADGTPKEILLHTSGSQKFSFEGELLEIVKVDIISVAIIAIGQQIVEIVIGADEAEELEIGERIGISTKAFAPTLSRLKRKRI